MFGNSEDDERMRNFLIFKFWGTDKELEEAGPFFGCIFAAMLIIGGLFALGYWLFK